MDLFVSATHQRKLVLLLDPNIPHLVILIQIYTETSFSGINVGVNNCCSNLIWCVFIVFVSTVTNKKPSCVSITKVKQFQGSSSFMKRSQWTIDQLRQVNGIDPNKVCHF